MSAGAVHGHSREATIPEVAVDRTIGVIRRIATARTSHAVVGGIGEIVKGSAIASITGVSERIARGTGLIGITGSASEMIRM